MKKCLYLYITKYIYYFEYLKNNKSHKIEDKINGLMSRRDIVICHVIM